MKRTLRLREKFMRFLVELTRKPYVSLFKKKVENWNHNRDSLLQFSEGSLGNSLGKFLTDHNIELMPKLENHDVYHVILGYGTSARDEARMQLFLLGNGKRSLYVIASVLLSLILLPEYFFVFIDDYKRGETSKEIYNWQWEYLLQEPLEKLQEFIFENNWGGYVLFH